MSTVARLSLASAAFRLTSSASPRKKAMKYRASKKLENSSLRSVARSRVTSASARRFRRSWLNALLFKEGALSGLRTSDLSAAAIDSSYLPVLIVAKPASNPWGRGSRG
jgi:hypothetical protein